VKRELLLAELLMSVAFSRRTITLALVISADAVGHLLGFLDVVGR
jgi:hypothetical protein